jgi:hypothetical protein
MIGSGEELVEKILDVREAIGLHRFIGQVDWGGLPHALVEESIARFATEIAPAVRAAAPAKVDAWARREGVAHS